MSNPSWQSTVVAVAFIALVGVMFWKAVDSEDFATVWAGVGTVVGVVVGAIPSFFFKAQADAAAARADKANARERAITSIASEAQVNAARALDQEAFK
jgi:hypothetical protein